MDFIAKDNLCGQNLLRITSRGSAVIAELLRLSGNIPEVFWGPDRIKDAEHLKYLQVLFDFHYLREPEEYEKKINDNLELLDLDQEFQENHEDIIGRFYVLFESIWKYQHDLAKFVEDVKNGFYIHYSIDNILEDVIGKQLLCEAIYLYGIMLIFLEEYIPGYIREKMLVCVYRFNGEGNLDNIDEVCKLCRNTGYIPNVKKPKNHPESLFARFAPDSEMIRLVIGKLQTDDIYLMSNHFPHPDHRSTRLATQATMLYVILYFSPDVLNKQKATMREIVDKYFNDNWVIAIYMGQIVDLTVEWASYPAAKLALDNVYTANFVRQLNERNSNAIKKSIDELNGFLKEGVLQADYFLDNCGSLLNAVRSSNVCLRWRLLHRRAHNDGFRKLIKETIPDPELVNLLLNASQLEYLLKELLGQLLADKETAWTSGKESAAARLVELSEYFTGEKALTRVKKDENLMRWFSGLAEQVRALNFDEEHATSTGRKIQSLIAALEDVEQFEAVDRNIQIKSFLQECRDIFRQMIRTVNIKSETLTSLETIADLSYAWTLLEDFLAVFHERISKNPSSVVLLRATFLKASLIVDVPLVRINAIDSPDLDSVAEYYSHQLVDLVRKVLEILPISVFRLLHDIERLQTHQLVSLPLRFEAKDMKDYAQLDLRLKLSAMTHQVSVFTEGILVMEKTLLGNLQVEPRQILEEGLRRELVRLVARAMHEAIDFPQPAVPEEIHRKMMRLAASLDGLKRSIEYLQDYIGLAGLKLFQEEFCRVISYNLEQEANRYLKKKTFDSASRYQSKSIPIPRYSSTSSVSSSSNSSNSSNNHSPMDGSSLFGSVNFMGRALSALWSLTEASRTVFAVECSAWYSFAAPDQKQTPAQELCGIRTFALLERSMGTIGLRGLDRLLAFRTVYELNGFLKFYNAEVHPFKTLLDQVRSTLFPQFKIQSSNMKLYTTAMKKVEKLMLPALKYILKIGQGQLLRRQITNLLNFGCQLDANFLYQALDTFNHSLVNEIHRHYRHPEKYPYPAGDNPLLYEVSLLTEATGMDDPLLKVYITSPPLEGLPVFLFLFLLSYLPKLEYDPNFGSLIRKKSIYPLDGAPLAVGLACLLKQFHPIVTNQLLAYLGQFVRSTLHQVLAEADQKSVEVPREVLTCLIFLQQLVQVASIPIAVLHNFVPPYILESIHYPASTTSK